MWGSELRGAGPRAEGPGGLGPRREEAGRREGAQRRARESGPKHARTRTLERKLKRREAEGKGRPSPQD